VDVVRALASRFEPTGAVKREAQSQQ
jgi:hypothetical protein